MAKITRNIFIVIFCFLSVLSGFGQSILSQTIEITPGEYNIPQVFNILKENKIPIAYSSSLIPSGKISILAERIKVAELLNKLSSSFRAKYEIKDEMIVISFPPEVKKMTIKGTIRDLENGEVLIGATIMVNNSENGVITNNYGYYSLTLEPGIYPIQVGYLGYKTLHDTINLAINQTINFDLSPIINELTEVTVSALPPDFNISSLVPGFNTLRLSTEGQIPYFLGEVDVLQGATLLPGIRTLGEDANGLNIRGGSTDENLILLDEATVYNPNHLYGLISVFNPEAVNSIEIMKGFIPPSYGGRASSVITVHQKDGDDQNYHFTGGAGIVSGKFIAEGPIKKSVSSFILSGRQSIFDLSLDENTNTSFQDLNAKINWKINNKNTLFLSGYYGNDRSTNTFETVRNWGNRNISLRWNHLFGNRIFSNNTTVISEYNYKITQPRETASYIGQSKILDYTLKTDWGYTLNPNHEFQFGIHRTLHQLSPGDRVPYNQETSSSNPLHLDTEHGLESALYVSHQAKFGKLSMLYGLRYSGIMVFGPGEVYQYNENTAKSDDQITDTIQYKRGHIIKSYFGAEPRFSAAFEINHSLSIKASYTKSYQYLHLISSTVTPTPTDIWKISDTYIKPTYTKSVSLGIFKNFADNKWESYIDTYYKHQYNLLDYKNGADLLFNANPETELLNAEGRAYGLEVFVKKNQGKLTGWLSYTLSRSETKIDGRYNQETVNGGSYFPSNHDKKHDISVVGIYKFTKRLSTSLSFNYSSGRPFTLPTGKYEFEGHQVPKFENRNNSRLPAYHRMDLSFKWEGRKLRTDGSTKKFQDYWTLVAYNLYGRNNVYSYVFEENANGETVIVPYTLFDFVIPAITYHFKF